MSWFNKVKGFFMADVTSKGQERIISNDGSTKIGITERDVKLTKLGTTVAGAEEDDLVLNDEQNVFKIVKKGTTSVSATGTGSGAIGSTTITHNLGYIPVVIAFVSPSGTYLPLPWSSISTGASAISFTAYAYLTNITSTIFDIDLAVTGSNTATLSVTYYILQETAA